MNTQNTLLKQFGLLLSHLFVFVFLCALESGVFTSKSFFLKLDFWMASLVFLFLHRDFKFNLVFCSLAALACAAFTQTPLHLVATGFLTSLFLLFFIKLRVFSKGHSYFVLCVFIALISFYLTLFVSKFIFYGGSLIPSEFVAWLTSALITASLAFLIRPIHIRIDHLFKLPYPFGFEVE